MLAITNARIETISQGVIPKGQILLEDGKIAAIGPDLEVPAGARVIDARGRTVTPGVIEAHCHAGLGEEGVGSEGNDVNEATNPLTPWCSALDGINMEDTAFADFRAAGITTANILPGSGNILGGTSVAVKCKKGIVDEAILLNPSGMKAALGENPKMLYGSKKKQPATRMGSAALLREALLKTENYLEKLEDDKLDKGPDFDQQAEALLPVIKGEIPLRIHCHRADDIVTAVRIAREFNLNFTLEHITEGYKLVGFLKESQIQGAIGPTMWYGSKVENRERDFRTPVFLAREGVHFCFITDHPVVAGRYLPMTAGLAVGRGMARDTALRSITLSAAEHVGIEGRVGSLEEGKDADLVVWSGDPLDFTTFADLTIIDGEIVYEREVE